MCTSRPTQQTGECFAGRSVEVVFDLITPLDEPTIREQVRQARSRRLPEVEGCSPTLTIVAGGPSALQAPLNAPTAALNGALDAVFNPRGVAPTYYAACDPQALVARFLTHPPAETAYYLASKCHPDVFDALGDRDVRLWHVGDYVPGGVACAPSITLTALNLFARLGWRRFEVWGWDCCYRDGRHHAGEQGHRGDDRWVEVGDRTFHSTTAWAAEAQDALLVLALLEWLGCEVVIKGDSMVEAIRRFRSIAPD